MKRRTLLRSIFLAPLAAVVGKLVLPKPVERLTFDMSIPHERCAVSILLQDTVFDCGEVLPGDLLRLTKNGRTFDIKLANDPSGEWVYKPPRRGRKTELTITHDKPTMIFNPAKIPIETIRKVLDAT